MVTALPVVRVVWPKAFRLIRSIHPPIDLFEDIADPRDWEALASAESKTNPRLWEHLGRLDLVPPDRRVSGPGASYLMAPFVHVSRDRPGRFTDGSYGVYSAGNSEEVAIREVAHHHARAMRASAEAPGWTSQFRMLVNRLDLDLHDGRGQDAIHDPDNYAPAQALGRDLRRAGSNGVLYRSVRCPGGDCAGIFWPDLIPPPVQADHFDFHWDGTKVDRIRNCRTGAIFGL
ncbi:RES family NAD+ phosphorylase [Devosia sediminis]|uniref:RES family NAD+ phosphorylase n=1 Tax=Devosia sediminis TaxID=2798801 RepID=A0A934MLG1_9HYPH|nr:RES family NAD+ phosphorylase [Devosia sediminis]MBJ3785130.1 RES family NAD+ phosphorylase [Devosia sediminis]